MLKLNSSPKNDESKPLTFKGADMQSDTNVLQ